MSNKLRIAVLSPICWRTPPRQYGPWEQVASNIAEGLVAKGHDVTLFATGDSITAGKLDYICPRSYEEDKELDLPRLRVALDQANAVEARVLKGFQKQILPQRAADAAAP